MYTRNFYRFVVRFLCNYQKKIEEAIENYLQEMGPGSPLGEVCSYALLNGGKRFRPVLVLMVAKAVGQGYQPLLAALGIEFFHTASLIADDLPCMDNDDFRRNKPSTHKVFGENGALLASYALIAEGYRCLARNPAPNPEVYQLAVENASLNTGLLGATGGQYLDLTPPDLSLETVREVLHKKTVTLFEISFVLGWLYGGGDKSRLEEVKQAASHFGMAFQIADDFEDQEQDRAKGRRINLANLLGVEKAKKMFHVELDSYFLKIKDLGIFDGDLSLLGTFLEERSEELLSRI